MDETNEAVSSAYQFKIEKANKAHMQKVLRELKNSHASDKDAGKLVAALRAHFHGQADGQGEVCHCDNCGGLSPESFDVCPFCAIGGGDVDAAAEIDELDGDNGNGSSTAGRPAVAEAQPKRTKVKSGTVQSDEIVMAQTTDIVDVAAQGKRPAPDLDQAITRVNILKAEGAVALWKLGAEIAAIYDKQVWKQRMRENSKGKLEPAYKSFDAFCNEELGMTHGNAYDLMDLAKHYDETRVRQFGSTKLTLLLRAPNEEQPEIMRDIEKGATQREVKAKVREAKAKHGMTKRDTGRKRIATPTTPRIPDKLTLAVSTSRRTVPFVTRATAKQEEPKAAKRVADEPVGKLELTNRVTQFFALAQNNKGELVLIITYKRDD